MMCHRIQLPVVQTEAPLLVLFANQHRRELHAPPSGLITFCFSSSSTWRSTSASFAGPSHRAGCLMSRAPGMSGVSCSVQLVRSWLALPVLNAWAYCVSSLPNCWVSSGYRPLRVASLTRPSTLGGRIPIASSFWGVPSTACTVGGGGPRVSLSIYAAVTWACCSSAK